MSLLPTSEPEAFVRAFCDSWASGDVDRIVSFFSPDVIWENVPIGIVHGRADAAARIRRAFASARTMEWRLLAIALSSDGRVLTERIDLLHLPRGTVELRIMGIFELAPTGIALWRDYFDLSGYERQLRACGAE